MIITKRFNFFLFVPLGNVTLDKGYCSRKSAQAVVNDGGTPVIDLKKNVTAKFVGNFFGCQTECIK